MKKVLFLNHRKHRCGVQQFGQIVAEVLKASDKFDVEYREVDERPNFESIKEFDVVIYNYHDQTMRWLTSEFTGAVGLHIPKQFCLTGHDCIANFEETKNIIADPEGIDDEKTFYTGRILPEIVSTPSNNKKVTIGSFGFGFAQKNFGRIVEIVNNEFDEAVIRLHVPSNDFADVDGGMASMFLYFASEIAKPGIEVQTSSEFLGRQDMVKWLSRNDINIFVYDDQPGRGLSSATDFALAARKPIGISRSSMFRHLWDDDILVENSSLKDILGRGTQPLEKYYTRWSRENAVRRYEEILLS